MRNESMGRRDCIALVGGAAVAWPLAAMAQQQRAVPVIGYISGEAGQRPEVRTNLLKGLAEVGFVEGRNVAIEYRYGRGAPLGAVNQSNQALIDDLVRRRVDVIVTFPPFVQAVKAATSSIPIVYTAGNDPVRQGLVASLNRPGGNVTGVLNFGGEIYSKRLGLLAEILPTAPKIAFLNNSGNAAAVQMEEAARTLGKQLLVLTVCTEDEVDEAFATAAREKAQAAILSNSAFFYGTRMFSQLVVLSSRYAIPTISYPREFVEAGGLMSYGTSLPEVIRQVGIYTGRILKGEKPADLPIMLPTKFELVINLRTAKALGLTVPPTLLAVADELIE
jgi:putative ABC transport system substrate-binding protein